ncbi:MAG: (E)-4-hydroxy-3-methylbut-2-enyl-diphosphate synthase [Paludibacteraceae bacterium]|nr:(E)-4-hydroxy-3-methylbut-2-enyl-diphosphate synthase [Paludibacteraceae bacterium]
MNIQLTYHRRHTTTTKVGHLEIGSEHPVRIQTMANTSTNDIEGSVAQAARCIEAGAELLRFTTQGIREVESLAQIHAQLQSQGADLQGSTQSSSDQFTTPLVADVHFQSDVADAAAKVVEKVRINPGNYIDPARKFKQIDYTDEEYQAELERLRKRFVQLLDICKQHKTALRIGVNHGSLSDRIMSRYGDTPEGMVESCMEFLRVAVAEDFQDIVLSIKASNTRVMVTTVRLLVWQMQEENMAFPLHLGVTEAGEGEDGRVKSAVGIGALLADGIGDTIRVSLSEAPEKELPVAKALVDYFADQQQSIRYASTTQVRFDGNTVYYTNDDTDWASYQLHAAAECGRLLWDYNCSELVLNNEHFSAEDLIRLSKDILQAARVRMYKTEYISCPGCGRTLFDLEQTIAQVKAATAHLQGLKIGIMGCIVNGPGEMADADYGYVGAGRGKVSLYRGKECVLKNIPQEEAVEQLLALIQKDLS